jgi:hypothetical protein
MERLVLFAGRAFLNQGQMQHTHTRENNKQENNQCSNSSGGVLQATLNLAETNTH